MRALAIFSVALSLSPVVIGGKIHGLNYNARRAYPDCPTVANVLQDLQLLQSLTDTVRLYSFTDCNQADLVLNAITSNNLNFNVLLGMWTTNDTSLFTAEYNAMVTVLGKYPTAPVKAIIVGSEAIYRGEQKVADVQRNVQTVKQFLASKSLTIPVTFADVFGTWLQYPNLIDVVDMVMVNKFPFWEGVAINDAVANMFNGVSQVKAITPSSKPFMISETGWPDSGQAFGNAVPNSQNHAQYFKQFVCQANAGGWSYLYFAAFDDGWKQPWQESTYDVEKHWGIFNYDRTAKTYDSNIDCSTVPTVAVNTSMPTTSAGSSSNHGSTPSTSPSSAGSTNNDNGQSTTQPTSAGGKVSDAILLCPGHTLGNMIVAAAVLFTAIL